MVRKPANVTETELAIMEVLWARESCEIREIVEAIYPEHTQARHTTVKSLLDRLGEKGFVESDASKFAHKFSAIVTRDVYVGQQLQRLADSHFDGAWTPMLLTLIDRVEMSKKQRDAIRKIVDGIQ